MFFGIYSSIRQVAILSLLLFVSAQTTLAQSDEGTQRPNVAGGQELNAKANAVVERLQNTVATIQRQLDVARSERNVVKVLFLSEKLSQANASLRSAFERRASVKAAVERGDAATARQDSEVLSIIGERSDEFLNATNQAVGEGPRMQDDATVNVTTDRGTPPTDQPNEFPAVDPLTGASDTNGRQSTGRVGVTEETPESILANFRRQLSNATTPEERQQVIQNFSKNHPNQAAQFVTTAIALFPAEAPVLTQAAVNGAPTMKTQIITAAVTAAPDQANAINQVVLPVTDNRPNTSDNNQPDANPPTIGSPR